MWSRDAEIFRNERCYACGDQATQMHAGKFVCGDCHDELKHGVVKNQNVNFYGGSRSFRSGMLDESPWGENAVRELEDGCE